MHSDVTIKWHNDTMIIKYGAHGFRYKLLLENLVNLQEDMKFLYHNGYGWPHPFTQCILKQRLKLIKYNTPVDISICNPYSRITDGRQVSRFRVLAQRHYCVVYFIRFSFRTTMEISRIILIRTTRTWILTTSDGLVITIRTQVRQKQKPCKVSVADYAWCFV